MQLKLLKPVVLRSVVATLLWSTSQGAVLAYESPVHVFSVDDVMGGFDGSTFGTTGTIQDPAIICGVAGGNA